jgi:predicted enzyme related to lactoylglutathione lyase
VPNVFDEDPGKTRDFYTSVFKFDVAMDMGWISTVVSRSNPTAQISIVSEDGEQGRDPFISIEVDDVDAVHAKAIELGHKVVYELRDEPWGVRRFMLEDPAGRTVNVLSHQE